MWILFLDHNNFEEGGSIFINTVMRMVVIICTTCLNIKKNSAICPLHMIHPTNTDYFPKQYQMIGLYDGDKISCL
jgi:hypothetical protein